MQLGFCFIFNYYFPQVPAGDEIIDECAVSNLLCISFPLQGSPLVKAEECYNNSSHWKCHQEDTLGYGGRNDRKHRGGPGGSSHPSGGAALKQLALRINAVTAETLI